MNFPRIESTALLVVDLQERLVPAMNNPCPVLDRSRLLLRGMAELGVDVLVTEQYPKGLGGTVPEIAELLPESSPPIAKTGFSAFVEPAFRTALAAKPRKTLVVAGIEAHVCVLQTVFDALNEGFEVILAADAVTSRKAADLAGIQYKEGSVDYLVLLDAERERLNAEDAQAQGEIDQYRGIVAIYKALGGGWDAGGKQVTAMN